MCVGLVESLGHVSTRRLEIPLPLIIMKAAELVTTDAGEDSHSGASVANI